MTTLKVDSANLRAGADRMDAEKSLVSGLPVPDAAAAIAGLSGFATAGVLSPARDAVVSALKIAGGRFELMAKLCRDTATTFELADVVIPGHYEPPWMSQTIADGLTAMGDINLSRD